jgi:hypothetical protein
MGERHPRVGGGRPDVGVHDARIAGACGQRAGGPRQGGRHEDREVGRRPGVAGRRERSRLEHDQEAGVGGVGPVDVAGVEGRGVDDVMQSLEAVRRRDDLEPERRVREIARLQRRSDDGLPAGVPVVGRQRLDVGHSPPPRPSASGESASIPRREGSTAESPLTSDPPGRSGRRRRAPGNRLRTHNR